MRHESGSSQHLKRTTLLSGSKVICAHDELNGMHPPHNSPISVVFESIMQTRKKRSYVVLAGVAAEVEDEQWVPRAARAPPLAVQSRVEAVDVLVQRRSAHQPLVHVCKDDWNASERCSSAMRSALRMSVEVGYG